MGWTGINTTKSFEDVFKGENYGMKVIKSIFLNVTGDYRDDGHDEEAEQFVVFKHKKGYKFICVILWARCGNEVLWNMRRQYRATAYAYMQREQVNEVEHSNGQFYSINQIKNAMIL